MPFENVFGHCRYRLTADAIDELKALEGVIMTVYNDDDDDED